MEDEQLIFKLREFYLLEMYQLKLFNAQIQFFPDAYNTHAYERMVEHEQQHVDKFAAKMDELGISKPELAGDTFSLAGFVSAKALDLMSLKEHYKLGVAVETKATEMYLDFINAVQDDKALLKMLWLNRTDEEFHKYWFKANLEKLALKEQLLHV